VTYSKPGNSPNAARIDRRCRRTRVRDVEEP